MHERINDIRMYLRWVEGAIPRARCHDGALAQRLELVVAEGAGLLAGQADDGRLYSFWVQVTTAVHDLEEAGLLPKIEPPPRR